MQVDISNINYDKHYRINSPKKEIKESFTSNIKEMMKRDSQTVVNDINRMAEINKMHLLNSFNPSKEIINDRAYADCILIGDNNEPYTGVIESKNDDGTKKLLTYEQGLIRKAYSEKDFPDYKEQKTKAYNYDSNGNLESIVIEKDSEMYALNSNLNELILNGASNSKTEYQINEDGYTKRTIGKIYRNGKDDILFEQNFKNEQKEDGTRIMSNSYTKNGEVVSDVKSFLTPDSVYGQIDTKSGEMKKVILHDTKDNISVEISNIDGHIYRKTTSKKGIAFLEDWGNGDRLQSVTNFKSRDKSRKYLLNNDNTVICLKYDSYGRITETSEHSYMHVQEFAQNSPLKDINAVQEIANQLLK